MRPSRSTCVASRTSKPAPELASMPRCVMCQSLPTPSLALYWHIGETTMRFGTVRPASFIGENKALGIDGHCGWREAGTPVEARRSARSERALEGFKLVDNASGAGESSPAGAWQVFQPAAPLAAARGGHRLAE